MWHLWNVKQHLSGMNTDVMGQQRTETEGTEVELRGVVRSFTMVSMGRIFPHLLPLH